MNCKSNGRSRFILLAAAVCLIGIECYGDDNTIITNVFGGSENAGIIALADSVKAWRTLGSVRAEEFGQEPDANDYPDYFRKTGEPVVVSTNLAAELSKLLLDKNSYWIQSSWKNCRPDADVVVTFSHGDKSLDLFLCIECKALGVNATPFPTYFDPSAPAFLRIIKKIFPNDREIQSLEYSDGTPADMAKTLEILNAQYGENHTNLVSASSELDRLRTTYGTKDPSYLQQRRKVNDLAHSRKLLYNKIMGLQDDLYLAQQQAHRAAQQ